MARTTDFFNSGVLASRAQLKNASEKRRMNALVSACSLPPELLLPIFKDVARQTYPYPQWVQSTTHVCTYWRSVALTSASLWTHILPWHDDQVYTFVSRSAFLPLKLEWGHPGRSPNLDTVASYTNCFEYLSLWLQPMQMTNFASKFLKMRWDSLQHLALGIPEDCEIHAPIDFDAFSRSPPKDLRSLALRCVFPWSLKETGMYRNLRSLEMVHCYGTEYYRPTMDDFLRMLETSTLLEDLALIGSGPKTLPEGSNHYPEPCRTVTLASLRSIYVVEMRAVDTAYLVSHFVFPRTAKLRFETLEFNSDLPSVVACLPYCKRTHFPHTQSIRDLLEESVSVSLTSAKSSDICLEIARSDEQLSLDVQAACVPMLAYAAVHVTLIDVSTFLQNSTKLESLSIGGGVLHDMDLISPEYWPSLLAGFSRITKLSVQFPPGFHRTTIAIKNWMHHLGALECDKFQPPLPQLKLLEFLDLPHPPDDWIKEKVALFIASRKSSSFCCSDFNVVLKEAEGGESGTSTPLNEATPSPHHAALSLDSGLVTLDGPLYTMDSTLDPFDEGGVSIQEHEYGLLNKILTEE